MKFHLKKLMLTALAGCLFVSLYSATAHHRCSARAQVTTGALFMMLLKRNADLTGSELTFSAYRHDNALLHLFPIQGVVQKYVTVSGEKDWVLVKLSRGFQFENQPIEHVLIRRNDKAPIEPKKSNQLVFFSLVTNADVVNQNEFDKSDFPLEFWALCR